MRRLIITFIFLFFNIICFAQLSNIVKHVEIVSEVEDTMILINKYDTDIINTMFYRYDILDSLNVVNEEIISILNEENLKLENVISEQKLILENKNDQILNIKNKNSEEISNLEKQLKIANIKKWIWEGFGIFSTIVIISMCID